MGKIFVPITGPVESKKAINKALELASCKDFEVYVVSFIDRESVSRLERYRIFVVDESNDFLSNMRKDAEKYLNYAKKIAEQKNLRIFTTILEGDPFTEFVNYIDSFYDDQKIICISKKSNEDNEELFGNLETKILRKTNYDILVIGSKKEQSL